MKKRIAAMALSLLLMLEIAAPPVLAENADDTVSALPEATQSGGNYAAYYQQIASLPAATETVTIKAAAFAQNSGNTAERLAEYKGRENVLLIADGEDSLQYTVTVPQSGRYCVRFEYYPMRSNERSLELGLQIDGASPFPGAESFLLGREFVSETDILEDEQGNQYAPRQTERFDWLHTMLKLSDGTVDDPAEIWLEAGEHRLTLLTIAQPYVLDQILLIPPEQTVSFADYAQQHPADTGTQTIKIEAEAADRKSDPSLRPASDRTSPLSSPYHPSKIRMNILSSAWSSPGQWLEWDFNAPADGWYYLGFRYQQFTNINFFVTRRLSVDGAVPYDEAKRLHFAYNQDWEYTTLSSADGEKLAIYLTAGPHTLRMEAVLGDYETLLDSLDATVASLNDLYRQIIMITGVSPDKYQDYYLDREVPNLPETLREAADTLSREYDHIREITQSRGAQASLLNTFSKQLESFLKKPETIPLRLSEFKNNVGSLAAWVLDLKSQPLELDYIYLYQENAEQPPAKAGFLQKVVHECRAFLASFFEDYNSMGSGGGGRSLNVWVGSGRDQVQIIRMMVSDLYTPSHHINVNLKLVNAGMVEAFLSGRAPDVALTIGRGQPLNLAVRGALADLSQFDDFGEVRDWFLPDALVPYCFENGCFGLPDTQSFYMMFARTDILDELGVTIPETWDDFYAVIPQIQRFNMEVGIPYTSVDAFGAADAGLGVRNIFPALLLQNGGSFYNPAGSQTALNTPQAVEAFSRWCALYRDYGLPVSYDFYNRFRTGEVPLGIASYTEYARLEAAAPEIRGLWTMVPIPGQRQSDGTINRAQAGSGSACVVLSNTHDLEASWDFLKWYCSDEAQVRYAKDVEAQMGLIARVPVANTKALAGLAWSRDQYAAISLQREAVQEVPEVLGGYYTIRGLDNAFRDVVYEGKNAKESLLLYNKQVNEEIHRKREEFGLE